MAFFQNSDANLINSIFLPPILICFYDLWHGLCENKVFVDLDHSNATLKTALVDSFQFFLSDQNL